MSVALSTTIKAALPGYRARWRERARVFLDALADVTRDWRFDWDGQTPIAKNGDDLMVAGFPSTNKDVELRYLLKGASPIDAVEPGQFRLARDLVTRFRYPHLRADLSPDDGRKPQGNAGALVGFHGQHRDTALHIADPGRREIFVEAFRPKPDDVILDCGAFLGLGELALSPTLTSGQMIAIEANSDCHALLSRNVSGSGYANIETVHAAIWNDHGAVLDLATGEAQANTLLSSVHDGGGRQMVQTASVDGLVSERNLSRLTMLSLTVNGAEVEALQGARKALRELRPRIRLAGWYERGGSRVAALCRPILEEAGYVVHVGPRDGVLALPKEAVA